MYDPGTERQLFDAPCGGALTPHPQLDGRPADRAAALDLFRRAHGSGGGALALGLCSLRASRGGVLGRGLTAGAVGLLLVLVWAWACQAAALTLGWDAPVGGTPPSGYVPQQCQVPSGGTTCPPVTIPNVTLPLMPRSWTVAVDVSSGPATYCWAMTAVKTGMPPSKPSNTVCQLMQDLPLEAPGNLRIVPTAVRAHLGKPGAIKAKSGR